MLSDAELLAVYNPTFSSRRVVVMDLGHSTIPRASTLPLEKLTWAHIADVQEDTQAGMMLICGAPMGWERLKYFSAKATYFKDWQYSSTRTNGSSLLALVHPKIWQIETASGENTIDLVADRTGLYLQLRRVTACRTSDVTILLTKIHLG